MQKITMPGNKVPWLDTRLNEEEMNFLNHAIINNGNISHRRKLAGNISRSELIFDKDNWFFESVLKKLTEKLFYRDWDVFCKYYIEKERPLPEFELDILWVNFQKQHEFNPVHNHSGFYSFVVFMKIPTHWKEQHALPISADTTSPSASDFVFVWSEKHLEHCINTNFQLSSADEGRILFFPASLRHLVYPFYECEEERVTISGNIQLKNTDNVVESSEKENIVRIMEKGVQFAKDQLEKDERNNREN